MSVRIRDGVIHLEGDCGVEDAEVLVRALLSGPDQRVDLSLCRQLHSAVVQALLAFRCMPEGRPDMEFLTRFVLPALAEAHGSGPLPAPPGETSMERPE